MARLFLPAVLVAALIGVAPVMAQDSFPTKPIRIIIPTPVGSAPDVLARLVGEQLAGLLRQPVIIENRPGGAGIIAAQAVTAASPAFNYPHLGECSDGAHKVLRHRNQP